jgi:hypothetical protein
MTVTVTAVRTIVPALRKVRAHTYRAPAVQDVREPLVQPEHPLDIVEEWGRQSFPASDAPANW